MEIPINKFDQEQEERRVKRPRKRIDPTLGIIIRVLVCCALIDIPIWSYFHFVKGVSMWEGLQQIRNEIQGKNDSQINKQIQSVEFIQQENTKIVLEKEQKNDDKKMVYPKQEQKNKSQVMYSWKNEKGIRVFSNVGFPEDGKYSEGKIEWY